MLPIHHTLAGAVLPSILEHLGTPEPGHPAFSVSTVPPFLRLLSAALTTPCSDLHHFGGRGLARKCISRSAKCLVLIGTKRLPPVGRFWQQKLSLAGENTGAPIHHR